MKTEAFHIVPKIMLVPLCMHMYVLGLILDLNNMEIAFYEKESIYK